MSIDTIGDFLTIIRNGVLSSKRSVRAPYAKMRREIASILKDEGFIKDFTVEGEGASQSIVVHLKYAHGESVIHEIKRVSTPGLRVYEGSRTLKPVIDGLGVAIITTNRGVMTDKKARQLSLGGEILCTVW